ncbi:MAG: hypothetical protein ABJD74_00400, partial [Roseibium sp.]|uniref:hypothetical protein n=1 Tax=Roseibium sp. TaxID=1936156 RepID=UPI003264AD23
DMDLLVEFRVCKAVIAEAFVIRLDMMCPFQVLSWKNGTCRVLTGTAGRLHAFEPWLGSAQPVVIST